MKLVFAATTFLLGNLLFAAQPPDLGHFNGLAFSSATSRHPLEIKGGSLVRCKPTSTVSDITTCEVDNGSVVVTGGEGNALNVKLTRVAVLRTLGKTPTRNYYFRGNTDLMVGGRPITAAVKITMTLEDSRPDHLFGILDLPEQYAKTSLEAFLVP